MDNEQPDEGEYMASITQAYAMLNLAHLAFHRMSEPDADSPTAMVALNQRDVLLISMALPALDLIFLQSGIGCFGEPQLELQRRLEEVIAAQNPDWLIPGQDESADAE